MKPRILIVEDDALLRDTLSTALSSRGWETTTAEDGVEGFRLWCTKRFDVVSTDFEMPGMHGLELSKKIFEGNKKATVFMFSGTYSAEAPALLLGIKGFFCKPDITDYLNALQKAKEAL